VNLCTRVPIVRQNAIHRATLGATTRRTDFMEMTINAIATATGVDRRTVGRYLADAKPCGEIKGAPTYRLRDFVATLRGTSGAAELQAERIRETRARAGLLETQQAELDKKLVEAAGVEKVWRACFTAMREHVRHDGRLPDDLKIKVLGEMRNIDRSEYFAAAMAAEAEKNGE
jgi:hypothetical protein